MPDTHLILHVKGTEQETTTVPKQEVRAAISQGQITHSQLIWSTLDHAWKQVRELPHLLPSQKLAPPPTPRVATSSAPKAVAVARQKTGPVPRVAVKASAGGTPTVRAAKPKLIQATGDLVIEEEAEWHPLKWLCLVLGVLILGTLAVNYLLVDQPLTSHLSQTPYARVTVYGHLGAFMQPNVLVIHIPASTSLTNANLMEFLVALAQSTPQAPLHHRVFDRVALTSGWVGRYSFSGYGWEELGEMGKDDPAQQKEFLLDQMGDAAGQPLMTVNPTLSDDALQAKRDKIWDDFALQFTGH